MRTPNPAATPPTPCSHECGRANAACPKAAAPTDRLSWTIDEHVQLAGRSRATWYREIAAGRLRTIRVGRSGVLITRENWLEYTRRQEVPARRTPTNKTRLEATNPEARGGSANVQDPRSQNRR